MHRLTAILSFVLLLAGVVILGRDLLFGGQVVSGPDLMNYFLPTTLYARGWLREGILPLWNTMTFCGWPLVGDPQLRWLYPPNLLLLTRNPLVVLSLLMLGNTAFGAIGMWFYLRRAAGVGPWPALCGAATLSLAGFFACHLMSGIVVFPATGAWAPWILLLGWRLGRQGATPATVALLAVAIAAQVLSGSPQIVFYTWSALLIQGFWCAGKCIASRRTVNEGSAGGLRPALVILARYAAGAALGIALAASSLIPSSEFGSLSLQRGGKARWEYVTDCSLAPRYLWTMVAPKFFGDPHVESTYWGGLEGYWDICGYAGIGPLAALLVALISVAVWIIRWLWGRFVVWPQPDQLDALADIKKIQPSAFAVFHLVLAGLALFLAFGRYNPAFRFFYEWIPGFDRFRVPSRWLFLWQFSVATILALVLEKTLGEHEQPQMPHRWALRAIALFAALLIGAALLSPAIMKAMGIAANYPEFDPSSGRPVDLQLRNWTAGSLGRAAAFAVGWLVLFGIAGMKGGQSRRRLLLPLAALLVLADVLTFGASMPTTRTPQGQAEEFYPRSALIEFMASRLDGHRFLCVDDVHAWWNDQNQPELWADRAGIAGLRDARGYYPLCLRWFGHFINALSRREPDFPMGGLLSISRPINVGLLSMLDVELLLSYDNLTTGGLQPARRTDFGLNIFKVTSRRGPAFLARARPTDNMTDAQEIELLTSAGFDAEKYALASGKPPKIALPPTEAGVSSVSVTRSAPGQIHLDVQSGPATDFVVVSEAYHPGWQATLDGQRTSVFRANHALIGVCVPQGRHQIDLLFRPASFRTGLYISLLAWGTLVAMAVAQSFRRRSSESDVRVSS